MKGNPSPLSFTDGFRKNMFETLPKDYDIDKDELEDFSAANPGGQLGEEAPSNHIICAQFSSNLMTFLQNSFGKQIL